MRTESHIDILKDMFVVVVVIQETFGENSPARHKVESSQLLRLIPHLFIYYFLVFRLLLWNLCLG